MIKRFLVYSLFVFITASWSKGQTVNNVDDITTQALIGWGNCGLSCAGGTGSATSPIQNFGQTTPSLDGGSMQLGFTGPVLTGGQTTNYLWHWGAGANPTATIFTATWNFYVPSNTLIQELEFDVKQFISGHRWFWGSEINPTTGVLQIWDQFHGTWITTSVTKTLSAATWHTITWNVHRIPGDTSCASSQPCDYYDSVVIDGTQYTGFAQQPSGSSTDLDNVGTNTQIDMNSTGGTTSVYYDKMTFTAGTSTGAYTGKGKSLFLLSPPPTAGTSAGSFNVIAQTWAAGKYYWGVTGAKLHGYWVQQNTGDGTGLNYLFHNTGADIPNSVAAPSNSALNGTSTDGTGTWTNLGPVSFPVTNITTDVSGNLTVTTSATLNGSNPMLPSKIVEFFGLGISTWLNGVDFNIGTSTIGVHSFTVTAAICGTPCTTHTSANNNETTGTTWISSSLNAATNDFFALDILPQANGVEQEVDWGTCDSGTTVPIYNVTCEDAIFSHWSGDINWPKGAQIAMILSHVGAAAINQQTPQHVAYSGEATTLVGNYRWAASVKYCWGNALFDTTNYQMFVGTGANVCYTTSGSQPSWNGTIGGFTTDGTCTNCWVTLSFAPSTIFIHSTSGNYVGNSSVSGLPDGLYWNNPTTTIGSTTITNIANPANLASLFPLISSTQYYTAATAWDSAMVAHFNNSGTAYIRIGQASFGQSYPYGGAVLQGILGTTTAQWITFWTSSVEKFYTIYGGFVTSLVLPSNLLEVSPQGSSNPSDTIDPSTLSDIESAFASSLGLSISFNGLQNTDPANYAAHITLAADWGVNTATYGPTVPRVSVQSIGPGNCGGSPSMAGTIILPTTLPVTEYEAYAADYWAMTPSDNDFGTCGNLYIRAGALLKSNQQVIAGYFNDLYCPSISGSPTWGINDGPASLPVICFNTLMANTPATGSVINVSTAAGLTAALSTATCGQKITLQAGVVFSGNFVLPALVCPLNNYLWIQGSQVSSLPPEGARYSAVYNGVTLYMPEFGPCYAGVTNLPGRPALFCPSTPGNYLPQIITPNSGFAFAFNPHTTGVRITGVEITRASGIGIVGQLVQIQNLGNIDHVIFDRVWCHGDENQDETNTCVAFGAASYIASIDSYYNNFYCISAGGTCTDSHALWGGAQLVTNTPEGVHKFVNNFIEASGENLFYGGAGSLTTPNDVEVRLNNMFKPLIWFQADKTYNGGVKGHPVVAKNLMEYKNVNRVLVEGNQFQNNWSGFTQGGEAWAFTPVNQSGLCPTCTDSNMTVRYNSVNSVNFFGEFSVVVGGGHIAAGNFNESVHDNVVDNMGYCQPTCPTSFPAAEIISYYLATTILEHDITINHNTLVYTPSANGNSVMSLSSPTIASGLNQYNMSYENNIEQTYSGTQNSVGGSNPANCANSVGSGTPMINACWTNYNVTGNCFVANSTHVWPSGNILTVANYASALVNYNNGNLGDYHIAPGACKGAGNDGLDPGANLSLIASILAGGSSPLPGGTSSPIRLVPFIF